MTRTVVGALLNVVGANTDPDLQLCACHGRRVMAIALVVARSRSPRRGALDCRRLVVPSPRISTAISNTAGCPALAVMAPSDEGDKR